MSFQEMAELSPYIEGGNVWNEPEFYVVSVGLAEFCFVSLG